MLTTTDPKASEKLLLRQVLEEAERRGLNLFDGPASAYGPQTDDELHEAIQELTGYRLARVAVCEGHVAPFDIFADLYFERRTDVLMIGNRGGGKRLALDTKIPTPDGWTTMGELEAGDAIFDERGDVCRVVEAHPVETQTDAFRVEFSDGTSVIADAEHLWETWSWRLRRCGGDKKKAVREPNVVTTTQIRETLYRKHGAPNELNHSIPVAQALRCPEADLPIDPWLFGVWLGDGCTDRRPTIHTNADEAPYFVEQLTKLGAEVAVQPGKTAKSRRVNFGGIEFREHLPADGKYVLPEYLRASIEQRRSLLQGLMDTDGHITKDGKAEITVKRPELRDGVMELLRTLGYKPTFTEKMVTPGATSNCAKHGTKEVYGPYYRIRFQPYADEPPVRMPHKVARLRPRPASPQMSSRRQIVAVEPVDSVPMRCITVDSPSNLYLCGEGMIPTHNTTISGQLHGAKGRWNPGYSTCIVGATDKQAVRAYKEFKRFIDKIADEIVDTLQKETTWVNRSVTEVVAGTIKGVNGPHPFFAQFDELELSTDEIFEEWQNMVQGNEVYGAQQLLSSTRKYAYGLIQSIVKECEEAQKQGIKPPWDVMIFCIFETLQNQPNCGVKDEEGNLLCGCDKVVKGVWPATKEGEQPQPRTFASVCRGRAKRSDGHISLQDAHRRFRSLSRRVWEAQQECIRPGNEGLVHTWWDSEIYSLPVWYPRPEYGPVYRSWDWGGTNPHSVHWEQLLKVPLSVELGGRYFHLPEGSLVTFDEIYRPGGGYHTLGEEVFQRTAEWHEYGFEFEVAFDFCDPAGASAVADVNKAAAQGNWPRPVWRRIPANPKRPSIDKHIEWGEDGRLWVVGPMCPNLVAEYETYHWPKVKEGQPPPRNPVEVDDHAMDDQRYAIWNLYKLGMLDRVAEAPAAQKSAQFEQTTEHIQQRRVPDYLEREPTPVVASVRRSDAPAVRRFRRGI